MAETALDLAADAVQKYENLVVEYRKLGNEFIEIQALLALVLAANDNEVVISKKVAEETALDDQTQFVTEQAEDGNSVIIRLVN